MGMDDRVWSKNDLRMHLNIPWYKPRVQVLVINIKSICTQGGPSDSQLLDASISTTALFKACLLLSKFSKVYKILDLVREQLFTLQKEP